MGDERESAARGDEELDRAIERLKIAAASLTDGGAKTLNALADASAALATIHDAVKAVAIQDAAKAVAVHDAVKAVAIQDAAKAVAVHDAVKAVAIQDAAKAVAVHDAVKAVAIQDAAKAVAVAWQQGGTEELRSIVAEEVAKALAVTRESAAAASSGTGRGKQKS